MSQQIKTPNQGSYTRGSSTLFNRASKAAILVAMSALRALRGKPAQGGSDAAALVFGDSFRPSVTGGDSIVTVERGLGMILDGSVDPDWIGDAVPVHTPDNLTIDVPINNDPGDRVDLIVAEISRVYEDQNTRQYKETASGPILTKNVYETTRYAISLVRVPGTPGSGAPSAGAGQIPICEVTRPNGVANIATDKVADVRPLDAGLFGSVVAAGRTLYLGRPVTGLTDWLKAQYDDASQRLSLLVGDTTTRADLDAASTCGLRVEAVWDSGAGEWTINSSKTINADTFATSGGTDPTLSFNATDADRIASKVMIAQCTIPNTVGASRIVDVVALVLAGTVTLKFRIPQSSGTAPTDLSWRAAVDADLALGGGVAKLVVVFI